MKYQLLLWRREAAAVEAGGRGLYRGRSRRCQSLPESVDPSREADGDDDEDDDEGEEADDGHQLPVGHRRLVAALRPVSRNLVPFFVRIRNASEKKSFGNCKKITAL